MITLSNTPTPLFISFTLILIITLSSFLPVAYTQKQQYLKSREKLVEDEYMMSLAGKIVLNAQEKQANDILADLLVKEAGVMGDHFPPFNNFYDVCTHMYCLWLLWLCCIVGCAVLLFVSASGTLRQYMPLCTQTHAYTYHRTVHAHTHTHVRTYTYATHPTLPTYMIPRTHTHISPIYNQTSGARMD